MSEAGDLFDVEHISDSEVEPDILSDDENVDISETRVHIKGQPPKFPIKEFLASQPRHYLELISEDSVRFKTNFALFAIASNLRTILEPRCQEEEPLIMSVQLPSFGVKTVLNFIEYGVIPLGLNKDQLKAFKTLGINLSSKRMTKIPVLVKPVVLVKPTNGGPLEAKDTNGEVIGQPIMLSNANGPPIMLTKCNGQPIVLSKSNGPPIILTKCDGPPPRKAVPPKPSSDEDSLPPLEEVDDGKSKRVPDPGFCHICQEDKFDLPTHVTNCHSEAKTIDGKPKRVFRIYPDVAVPGFCHICKEDKCDLPIHIANCHNEARTKCKICGEQFKRWKQLSLHIDRAHGGSVCDLCGKKFLLERTIKEHKLRYHESPENWPFHCKHCPKAFVSRCKYTDHQKFHEGGPTFTCQFCGVAFYTRTHVQSHSNACRFNPDKKTKKRKSGQPVKSRQGGLQRYEDMEGVIKIRKEEYACQECNRVFKNSKNAGHRCHTHYLSRHTPKETWSQACHLCPRRFVARITLKSHIKVIHGNEMAYSCGYCDKKFNKEGNRNLHEKKQHLNMKNFKGAGVAWKPRGKEETAEERRIRWIGEAEGALEAAGSTEAAEVEEAADIVMQELF